MLQAKKGQSAWAAVKSGPAALVDLGRELKINTKQALDVQRWQSSETVFANQKLTFASLGSNTVALLTLCSTELANTAGVNDGNIHTSRDRCHDITAIIATMLAAAGEACLPFLWNY